MKKFLCTALAALILITSLTIVAGAANLGHGASVIADDVTLIKAGLIGEKVVFSDTDFKTAVGSADFRSVKIETLPSSSEGTLMINDRRVKEGESIKRRHLAAMEFIPADASVSEAKFSFSVPDLSGEVLECTVKFTKKVNYAPKIDTDTAESASITTQSGISVYGNLNATDPEGDRLEYIIVSYPSYGTVSLTDKESGRFKYTPTGKKECKDCFTFVVRDEYGNYSKPEKVSVSVVERMSEVVYSDMTDSENYNAAVAMTAMGIMSGSRIGDDMYFSPDNGVTRAEFVAMAMKSLGIRADSTLSESYFDDNADIPKALVGYIATAAKCGIVNGAFDGEKLNFRPNDLITRCEAAIVMSNLLDIRGESETYSQIEGISDAPVWARAEIGAMYETGIFGDKNEALNLTEVLTRGEAAEYLYRLAMTDGK